MQRKACFIILFSPEDSNIKLLLTTLEKSKWSITQPKVSKSPDSIPWLGAPLLLQQDGATAASRKDSPSAQPPLARGRDPITNLKTWGQSWHPLRDSQRWRGRAGEEDCADGWAGLLCLYSWSQRAVKPLLRGKARHFCTRYSFLNCQAPGRGFKHSRVHLRQHLGRPHPMCGGGKTNSAKI